MRQWFAAWQRFGNWQVYLPFVVLAIGMAGMLIFVVVQIQAGPPAPLRYDQAIYLPERADLCPGENLVYTNTITIDRAGVVYSGATWFHNQGADAYPVKAIKLGDMDGRAFVQVPVTFTRRRSNVVPKLPPGPSEMRFVATDFRSVDAVHTVPFVVRADCGN